MKTLTRSHINTLTKNKDRFFAFSNKASMLTLDVMDCIGLDMFGEGITASAVSDAITTVVRRHYR